MKKVVVIGPESTGKSTLCEQLANYYNTSWVPEYAREYLTVHGMNYTYDDLLTIAKGQVAMEESYIEKTKDATVLFIDTDQYVMKVWGEFVFGKFHPWTLDQITERKYDLYLLYLPPKDLRFNSCSFNKIFTEQNIGPSYVQFNLLFLMITEFP